MTAKRTRYGVSYFTWNRSTKDEDLYHEDFSALEEAKQRYDELEPTRDVLAITLSKTETSKDGEWTYKELATKNQG